MANNDLQPQPRAPMSEEQLHAIRTQLRDTPTWGHALNQKHGDHLVDLATGRIVATQLMSKDADAIVDTRLAASVLLAQVERLRAVERTHQFFAGSPQAQAAIQREHDRFMAEHAAMRAIIEDLAAEVPDWHDSVRLHGLAVTFLAEREGQGS